ncbi:MAG: hypothetical protein NT023_06080 [Armatimonadetes bacterium]|nr:hypothetical protein [Armatimonadota bacterium]
MLLPPTGKFLVLTFLGVLWLLQFRRVSRLVGNIPYHVASYERDKRKAHFYYQSMWLSIGVALLSFLALEVLASVMFDTSQQREWVFSIVRGLGLWGLATVAMIWSQVGIRASEPNSDGQSLLPSPYKNRDKDS